MENKSILIAEDQSLLKDITGDLVLFLPALNQLKISYDALEVGELTNDLYKEIIVSRLDTVGVENTKQKYFDELNKSLDAAGLKRDSLRKVHIDQANEIYQQFEVALTTLKSVNPNPHGFKKAPALTLDNISFIDSKFQVSAMDEEDLLDKHCRIYLESKQEQEVYSKLKVVRDSLNDFCGFLHDLAVSHELSALSALDYAGTLTELSSLHNFITDDEVKQINPHGIKWLSEMFNRAVIKKNKQAAAVSLPVEKDRPHDHSSILKMNYEIKEQRDKERFAEKRRIQSELNN